MANTHCISGEFKVHATANSVHIIFRLPLAEKIAAAFFLCLLSVLLLGHLFWLFSSIYSVFRGHFAEAALSVTYGTEKWPYSIFFALIFVLISRLIYSLLWWLFSLRELMATHQYLAIQQTLFGKLKKISLSTDDIHYFNQFMINSDYGDSWQLEAVTGREPFKLYSHPKRYPVDWIGSTLADFYNAEFRMIGHSRRRKTRSFFVV